MGRMWQFALACLLALIVRSAAAQKTKVIVDQDARGPGTSDQQAILVFLQSGNFDVLGITTVSGDQWGEETQHVLRLLAVAERTDVPVTQAVEFPLLKSKEKPERLAPPDAALASRCLNIPMLPSGKNIRPLDPPALAGIKNELQPPVLGFRLQYFNQPLKTFFPQLADLSPRIRQIGEALLQRFQAIKRPKMEFIVYCGSTKARRN